MPLRVTNHSALPQKVSFVRLPDQIRVAPDDGLAIILPGETFVFHVILSLQSAVKRALTLTLRSSLGKEYTIKCVGMGVESPLRVSHTVVDFAPIPVGDKVDQSVFITNTSKKTKFWEAIVPGKEVSHLHISPLVGEIAPGATQRVEIEFVPVEPPADEPEEVQPLEGEEEKEEVEDEQPEKETKGSAKKKKPKKTKPKGKSNKKKPAKKGKGKAAAKPAEVEDKAPEEPPPKSEEAETKSEGETKLETKTEEVIGDEDEDKEFPLGSLRCSKPEEPPSRHGRWYMPIFCKGEGAVDAEGGLGAQFVEIRTTTVQRVLSVSKHRVDFSQVGTNTDVPSRNSPSPLPRRSVVTVHFVHFIMRPPHSLPSGCCGQDGGGAAVLAQFGSSS